jgi:outer membrane murein-binding lipoprotein Lpp
MRISKLEEEEEKVKELKGKVAELQKKVNRYARLPHDEKAARKEVDKLKAELERLRRKRDAMWENITNG